MDDESWEAMQKRHDEEWKRLQWRNAIPLLWLLAFLLALLLAGGLGAAISSGWR